MIWEMYVHGGMPPTLVNLNCEITMILEKGIVTSWKYEGILVTKRE